MLEFGTENTECGGNAPFVKSIEDNEDNTLKIMLSLPVVGESDSNIDDTGIEKLNELLKNCCPIYPDEGSTYEIMFRDYIMYQTRNESYCSWDDYEIRKGNIFILFERSRLLDQLQNITDCQILEDGSYYPAKWKHYGIVSQNHIIDIISQQEPVITRQNLQI